MKLPEITLNDLELIYNKLGYRVGQVLVSFFFSKIFIYESPKFVFENILKDCKAINKVHQMFSIMNLYQLPDNYKPLFYDKLKQTDIAIVTFKQIDVMQKEKKQIFEAECREFRNNPKKSKEVVLKQDIITNIDNPDMENQFNIISRSLKQLADIGIESTITFNFKTNIIGQKHN